jgi:hypothetical protein
MRLSDAASGDTTWLAVLAEPVVTDCAIAAVEATTRRIGRLEKHLPGDLLHYELRCVSS